jgi:hypothetical protein
MRDVLASVTGFGLLTVTGNEHKQMRKAMNPAFSLPNLVARKSIDSMEIRPSLIFDIPYATESEMYHDTIEG